MASLIVGVFGFLPIVDLVPGGRSASWYSAAVSVWLNGSLIAVGAGVLYAIASRRFPGLWREGALARFSTWCFEHGRLFSCIFAAVCFAIYAAVAILVFDRRPLLIDEIVQLLQARIFGEGKLARVTSPNPEFFSALHVIDIGSRYFSQFPAGGPAMYVPGWLVGIPWLTNPICGALSVVAFARWIRVVELRPTAVVGATILFGLSPFMVFMSGSHMNHVPALMWTVLALMALAVVVTSETSARGWAFLVGFCLAMAGTIRPVDALAFALPAGLWLLWRAVRLRRLADLLSSGLGLSIPLAMLLWINSRTTGAPLLFGYELLWGASHSLGFHVAPWGLSHTPARGVELISLYFLRLQNYLFETPVPSLVPVVGALALSRPLRAWDRFLLSSGALLIGLYFAYWHDGFYLGPRFLFPLMPVLAVLAARFPRAVRERFGNGVPYRAVWGAIAVSVALAVLVSLPIRARQYGNGLLTMRWDADAAAARAGVRNAIVLVRESWGAQLMARLWALGISRSESERLYRRIDACQLDSAITATESASVRGEAARVALTPLLRDSVGLQSSPFSPDTTEQFRRGVSYGRECLQRIDEDRAGFTVMVPLLLARKPDVLYIRDLHARDSLILARYPARDVFLLRPADASEGAPPVFRRLSRDSLYRAWRSVR